MFIIRLNGDLVNLKEGHLALFGGFQIFLDYLVDHLSLVRSQVSGLLICESPTHVPCHLEQILLYGLGVLLHGVHQLLDLFRSRGQEPYAKKLA